MCETLSNYPKKAVILAAGPGSRLTEITRHIPKTMIQVNKKYIFEYIAEAIGKCGISQTVFIVGYQYKRLMPLIKERCGKLGLKLSFVVNPRYKETNTMYSLWLARKHLKDSFIYFHGDLLFSYPMLKNLIKSPYGNAVLIDRKFPMDWDDAMKVITHNHEIKYMSKSITINEMDGIAIGIYKFNKEGAGELFKIVGTLIKKGVEKSWISEAINILAKNVPINVVENKKFPWVDVDNLSDLEMAKSICGQIEDISCAASTD